MNESQSEMLSRIQHRWEDLTIIGNTHGTSHDKLTDQRVENLRSDEGGLIHFDLERHGRTVRGSVYADVHHWVVDLDAGTAWIVGTTPRLIGKRSESLDTSAVVQAILDALKNEAAPIVGRTKDGRPRINIRAVVPEGPRETTQGRHRRIRSALNDALVDQSRSVNSRWIVEKLDPRP